MNPGSVRRLSTAKVKASLVRRAASSARTQVKVGTIKTAKPSLPRFASVEDAVRTLRPAEPMYCMHPDRLDKNAKLFLRHFPGKIFYAVKGNPDPYILQRLYAAGVRGFDVASIAEIRQIRELFADAQLAFMHPIKGREAIREAYFKHGVRVFVLDAMEELAKIRQETDQAKDLVLFVRLAMPKGSAVVSMSNKFGALPDEAVLLLQEAKKTAARVGLSFHAGHQTLEPSSYLTALEVVRGVISRTGFDLDILDVGGGFPMEGLGDVVPPLLTFFDTLRAGLASLHLPSSCEIWGEPGRALNGTGATLVVRVELRKGDALYINDGSYGSLFDMCWMGMRNDVAMIPADPSKTHAGAGMTAFHLYGPTCATEDHIEGPFMLPDDINEGDWIVFERMGGYADVMQTGFNGFRATGKVEIAPPAAGKLLRLHSSMRRGAKGGI